MEKFTVMIEQRRSIRRQRQIEQDIGDLKDRILTLQTRLVDETDWQDELDEYLA